eukprot:12881588-Prorocentrum_lima.AAC.1
MAARVGLPETTPMMLDNPRLGSAKSSCRRASVPGSSTRLSEPHKPHMSGMYNSLATWTSF